MVGLVGMLNRKCEMTGHGTEKLCVRPGRVPAAVGPARNRSRRVERKTNLRGDSGQNSASLLSEGIQNPISNLKQ